MPNPFEIVLDGQKVVIEGGTRILDLLGNPQPRPMAARLNQHLVSLDTPIPYACQVTSVFYADREGTAVYRRSACLILLEAIHQLFPKAKVMVGQSLAGGYYFDLNEEKGLPGDYLLQVERRMRDIVAEDRPFVRQTTTTEEAIHHFQEKGFDDKILLLKTTRWVEVRLVTCGDFKDIQHGPLVPSTGYIDTFELQPYAPGFVLRFPEQRGAGGMAPMHMEPGLFQIHKETKAWNRILGVENVGQLNTTCLTGEVGEVIKIAEGFHEKKIAEFADVVHQRKEKVRLVLIAGPSSSGKTTFSKRLMVQLRVNGLRPVTLGTDNYFVSREDTPLDENGKPDFECLEAVDLPLFNQHLDQLLSGEAVDVPSYDFLTGHRSGRTTRMQLGPNDILIVEGIHGLNPRLTESVPTEHKLKIYISALTQLSLDANNRILTTDVRLIRRIVRDRKYRGHSVCRTLAMWHSVLRGERHNIFPYQESADLMFNSALVYEPAVLRVFAERFLLEVPSDDEHFGEAFRLLNFVRMFVPIFPDEVPHTSILREFIGGSTFEY